MKLLQAPLAESSGVGPEGRPYSAGPLKEPKELALRLSVIDGADKLVYTDLRDRRGWRQALAADQALHDARTGDFRDAVQVSPAKVVIAHEQVQPGATAGPRLVAQSPYQVGKSTARAQPAVAYRQLDARKTVEPPAAQVARPVSRSR
jgi:hypothetical protein